MKKEYSITGMTCGGCVSKVQETLNGIDTIQEAYVQLEYPQAVIDSKTPLDIEEINAILSEKGNYAISTEKVEKKVASMPEIKQQKNVVELPEKSLSTYKPLLLIVAFISGVSLLTQYPFNDFSGMLWMRHFMAGFFIVFAFFKLLNLQGFANSYRMYDVIAAKWKTWGVIYPFVELALGVLYLVNIYSYETNLATVIILVVSSIGVIQSNLNNKKIKCACLGDVFNLPMSTVTIVEDLTMVAMAVVMLLVG